MLSFAVFLCMGPPQVLGSLKALCFGGPVEVPCWARVSGFEIGGFGLVVWFLDSSQIPCGDLSPETLWG
jgi:hypothetical protein